MKAHSNIRQSIAANIFLLGFSIVSFGQCYELVWAEEFDYTGNPDNEVWTAETGGGGFGNNELQYYTKGDLDNAKVENGLLTITAIKEDYSGNNYTSARLISKDKYSFQYGKIEAKIKTPYGQGIWPAFWMMGENISSAGWPACGEIDILEMIGGGEDRDDRVYGTLHWDSDGHASYGGNYQLPSGIFADDFHTFSIEWTPSNIRWFIDGSQFHVVTITEDHMSEFHQDFFILLNLAVGGDWPGAPDASTVFPQSMEVDYVRVYKESSELDDLEIVGKDIVPQNSESESFHLPSGPNWIYNWTIPDNAEIIDGEGTNEITVKWGCEGSSIQCDITGTCKDYTFSKTISTETLIAGPSFADENEQNLIFHVPPMHGTQYNWIVPEGVNIISGSDNDTLVVNWGDTFAPIGLDITNDCGTEHLELRVLKTGQYPYPDIENPHKIPGTINAINYDLGGASIAYFDHTNDNLGNGPRQNSRVDTEIMDNGNPNIAYIDDGEWVEYTVQVDSTSYYEIKYRAACGAASGGPFVIKFNGSTRINNITVPSTGAWDTFKTYTTETIELTPNDTLMRLYFAKGGFNISQVSFTPTTKPASFISEKEKKISIWPVPSKKQIFINGLQENSSISIYNIKGLLIEQMQPSSNTKYSIDISAYNSGIYLMKISAIDGSKWLGKFVKSEE